MLLAVSIMAGALSLPASALDYTFDGADGGLFAAPTSYSSTIGVPVKAQRSGFDGERSRSVMSELSTLVGSEGYGACGDVSKNAAYIPPAFGSPTSYTLITGELLTPNLVSQSLEVPTGGVTVMPPSVGSNTGCAQNAYTSVIDNLYYSGGHIGTLKISAIGLSVKVYEGTDNATLAKGAGYFTTTSVWDGNIAVAAHNRGTNSYFGKIHTLHIGDTVTFTTLLGTRSYEVYSVSKISVNDTSVLDATGENNITLVTCVENEPENRWCVRAREV